jgi:hypothetical protein
VFGMRKGVWRPRHSRRPKLERYFSNRGICDLNFLNVGRLSRRVSYKCNIEVLRAQKNSEDD